MNRYHACGYDGLGSCGIAGDTGDYVLAEDARREIDILNEQIHDLKALLYRAADALDASGPENSVALKAEIAKALS